MPTPSTTSVFGLRRQQLVSIVFASVLLTLKSAYALSVSAPSVGGRSIHYVSVARTSKLFPTQRSRFMKRRSSAFTTTNLLAAEYSSKTSVRPFQSAIRNPRKLAFTALSKISRHVTQLRRSILRAAAILSLLLFGMKSVTAPAHAARSKQNTEVVSTTVAKSSISTKGIKLFVTAGAVAAGGATAKKIQTSDESNDEDRDKSNSDILIQENSGNGADDDAILNVVPKDEASPLPLSAEWINQQINDVEEESTTIPPSVQEESKPTSKGQKEEQPLPLSAEWINQQLSAADGGSKTKPTTKGQNKEQPSTLVKDLDSKIEMLRAREELAKADAERKRLDDIEKAAEALEQDQAEIDAQIAAAAEREHQMERERLDRIQREKAQQEAQEREKRLADLEQGKKEQQRLEQTKKDSEQKIEDAVDTVNGKVVDVEKARQQPKPMEEEQKLREKYGDMDLEERAFNILVDLGMVDLHADPDPTLEWDEDDNAFM